MPTLALSMIVKNAEASLDRCLESVRGLADEIVIADTGSTDSTPEIARRHGAKILSIPWEQDFAKARNRSLAAVESDWVLVLDADEMLDPKSVESVRRLLAHSEVAGYIT
ncbi:MAG: glycosyltransferase family 2 protein, partial [Terriglobia bacterium]